MIMAKTGTSRKLVVVLLAVLALIGGRVLYKLYDMAHQDILESSGIDNLKVEELSGVHPTRLKISARLLFSGAVIRTIAEKEQGSTITILVHLAAVGEAKPKTTGGLEYELSVPDSVNEVRFGHSSTLIWKRGASPAQP